MSETVRPMRRTEEMAGLVDWARAGERGSRSASRAMVSSANRGCDARHGHASMRGHGTRHLELEVERSTLNFQRSTFSEPPPLPPPGVPGEGNKEWTRLRQPRFTEGNWRLGRSLALP